MNEHRESLSTDGPMQKPKTLQVRMLVGKYEHDTLPVIAGCIDSGLWEVEPQEDTDARFAAMKRVFDDHDLPYEWREVTVTLDAGKLLEHFAGPVLDGEVERP